MRFLSFSGLRRFTGRRRPIITALCIVVLFATLYMLKKDADEKYYALLSVITYDHSGEPLRVSVNSKDNYALPLTELPEDFTPLLIQKEDRFFYYHPGINPLSMGRALFDRMRNSATYGGSTITQQLAKNLLGTEAVRTISNKLLETTYAIALELFLSKDEVLLRYANTVSLGNQTQGFESGSRAYFGKAFNATNVNERLSLLAALSHPSTRNPWADPEGVHTRKLAEVLGLSAPLEAPPRTTSYSFQKPVSFELSSLGATCAESCITTIDSATNEAIRAILQKHILRERHRGVRNGAVVVIDSTASEIVALVGTVDPRKEADGGQINMTIEPRPIGSTVKPFIYLKGFLEGLRPYTLVDDREYRYPIATGYALYPKNYDGRYHGIITLHEALANSLNVPSVKVLEFIGLNNFYRFMSDALKFKPIQPFDSYQYGIALGGLETDLLTLTYYFTLFPRGGTLAPLRIFEDGDTELPLPPHARINGEVRIAPPEYVELVNTILSDRLTGVEQFGLKSNLNLSTKEYAVKTGTSRDFHDSWVIGYTPDIVVGVWVGNVENEAMDQISGQSGAGAIWHEVMEHLLAGSYAPSRTLRKEKLVETFPIKGSIEWGLSTDTLEEHHNLLISDALITSIHEGDVFELKDDMAIPLRARREVTWSVNGQEVANGRESAFVPKETGTYEIMAVDGSGTREILNIKVTPGAE